ncbi:hypothetical protein GEMRC1_006777 [Eukaryota sp. GEM-RC1]
MRDLKAQIQPRDEQLSQMKDHIEQMDKQLEMDHQNSINLELLTQEQSLRIKSLGNENQHLKTKLSDRDRFYNLLLTDLQKTLSQVDPKFWRECLQSIYNNYNSKQTFSEKDGSADATVTEVLRHRNYLQKSISTLSKSLEQVTEASQQEKTQKIHENSVLLEEVNELRKTNLSLLKEKQSLNSQNKELKSENRRLTARSSASPSLHQPALTAPPMIPGSPKPGQQHFSYTNRRSLSASQVVKGRPGDHFQIVSDQAKMELLQRELMNKNDIITQLNEQVSMLKRNFNSFNREFPPLKDYVTES